MTGQVDTTLELRGIAELAIDEREVEAFLEMCAAMALAPNDEEEEDR
jgi:hypothetical protein